MKKLFICLLVICSGLNAFANNVATEDLITPQIIYRGEDLSLVYFEENEGTIYPNYPTVYISHNNKFLGRLDLNNDQRRQLKGKDLQKKNDQANFIAKLKESIKGKFVIIKYNPYARQAQMIESIAVLDNTELIYPRADF
ncbi:MAG TPA: hypothetical protein VN132_07070 [Bdellovibrio sp.]|nr:hypothetical protein [Bdellovibrio sp.]